jgi:adenosine deaminase
MKFLFLLLLITVGFQLRAFDVYEDIGPVLSDYRLSGKTVVTLIGHSGQGYQDSEKFKNRILEILKQFDPKKTIINIGGTPDGIGLAYSIIKEISHDFETRGIVSELALKNLDEVETSRLVDKLYVIKGSSWGGYLPDGSLSNVSEAMVSVSNYLYGLGGGDVGYAELTEGRRRSKNVIFNIFEVNHSKAIEKALNKGDQAPLNFLATASEKFKPHKQIYFIDRMQSLALEFLRTEGNQTELVFKDFLSEQLAGSNRARVISIIKENLKLRITGENHTFSDAGEKILLNNEFNQIGLYLGDQHLGSLEYSLGENNLFASEKNIKLSAFDLRQFSKSGDRYLKTWNKFNLHQVHPYSTASLIDIHSHYGGAVRAESLVRVAVKRKFNYPTYLLREMGINISGEGTSTDLSSLESDQLLVLEKNLSISPTNVENFTSMENFYKRRSPLTKDIDLFKEYLFEIAKDFSDTGVDYTELSISDIIKPEYLNAAHEVLPEIERKLGVKLRFVVGIWRLAPQGYFDEMVQKVKHIIHSPYIVGVDFMGHETNSTFAFERTIRELAELREDYPNFKIKVHAGENPLFPENVRVAVDAGATHLSHVLYGVDEDILGKIKDKGIILDFAGTSNYSLNNIYDVNDIPIRRYLELFDDLKISLASDGHGLYQTDRYSELDIAVRAGLSEKELQRIFSFSKSYVKDKVKEFGSKITE